MMGLFGSIKKSLLVKKSGCPSRRFYPQIEGLESRLVPYTASGNVWPNPQLLTISFMPDGTNLGPATSNLFSTFNAKFGSAATWQNVILKAAQQWAQQTNLNFAVVPDSGAPEGSGSYQQGDPTMGDIRIGGYNFGSGSSTLAQAYEPPPVDNYSIAGDIQFNTGQTFNINGQNYDLFTVAVHEFGHALGLYHSGTISAALYATYGGAKTGLASDDIAGIRSVYSNNSGRAVDAFGSTNSGFSTAASLNGSINGANRTALVSGLDITTAGEKDFYTATAPAGTGGTVTISVQSQGLSLLAPTLTVYAADQVTVLGSASGSGHYGTTLTLNLAGKIAAGQQFYVRVGGADSTALGTGAYALTLSFAGNPLPTVPLPNTQTANGNPLSGGGGQANAISQESRVNTTTNYAEQTFAQSQAVATDQKGNYVIAWSSYGQDGSGWGVYARRFNATGVPQGPEFQVNTYTAGDQTYPSVAVNANGDFVVTWSSYGQDGSGWGVYAQQYAATGQKIGNEFRVNTTTAGDQEFSNVATDARGDFVVTWSSYGQDGSGWGVYARRYDPTGTPVGGEFRVNTYTTGDQIDSKAAMNVTGTFVITWMSYGQDGSGWGVYAQQYAATGQKIGDEFRVNTTTAGDQAYPAVAINNAGDFVVTWSSDGQDHSGWGVYARQYGAGGATPGGEFQVNTTTVGDQMHSSVAMESDGSYLITWSSDAGGQSGAKSPLFLGQNSNTWDNPVTGLVSLVLSQSLDLLGILVGGSDSAASGWDVYAQQFDETGAPQGNEFRVNTTTAGDQQYASVAMSPTGTTVVVWSGNGAGDGDGVFAQTYATGSDNLDAGDSAGVVSTQAAAPGVRPAPGTPSGFIGGQPSGLSPSGTDPVTRWTSPEWSAAEFGQPLIPAAAAIPGSGPFHASGYAARRSPQVIGAESLAEDLAAPAMPLPGDTRTPPDGARAPADEGMTPERPGDALGQPAVDRCFAAGAWDDASAGRGADPVAGGRHGAAADPAGVGLALTAVLGSYHWGQHRADPDRKRRPPRV